MPSELENNQELAKALAEFETQEGGVKAAPSAGPEIIDVLQEPAVRTDEPDDIPKITQWVIKYSGGLVKDTNVANYLLLFFVILAMGVSFYFFWKGRRINSPAILPGSTISPGSPLNSVR